MAGLGRKVFTPGEVLTATNVQNYLMDQAVQVYAGTAARGSAIGSATTEGMVSWLADSNQLQVATGTAAWADVSFVQSPNYVINGAFDFWQRGTSFTNPASSTYNADRWQVYWDGTGTRTISRQTFTAGSAPVPGYEGTFFYRFAQTTAGTGGTYNNFLNQPIESVRSLAGEVVTVSFWAKADATRIITPSLEQNFGTGGSPSATVNTSGTPISLTTSWTRYSQTLSIPSISGKTLGTNGNDLLRLILASATNNATQTIDIWGVQIEGGSVATPFRRNAPSIQAELAACQRYFIASPTTGNTYGMSSNTTSGSGYVAYARFPVPMRVAPTTVTLTNGAITSAFPTTPSSAQGITSFGFYEIRTANATSNGYFGGNYTANAEL